MPSALREKRANVWAQMQETRAAVDKDGWTDELRSTWDKAERDLNQLSDDIKRDESEEAITKRFGEIDEQTRHVDRDGNPGGTKERDEYRDAFRSYLRGGPEGLTAEERQLLQANFRTAQSSGTTTTGGYTVPQGFWDKVTETLKWYGGVENAGATVIRTDSGQTLPWPTNDDTGNVGAILAENTQLSSDTGLTFGQKSLGGFMYTSDFVKASLQFLQDSAIDPEAFIARKIGQRLGRIWNTHQTVGTATTQPQGCVVGASAGATCAASATVTFDDLIKLQHSVDIAYRMDPKAGYMMNDTVVSGIRRLKDNNGQYLWQPSLQEGQPDRIVGRPLYVNNDMASIGSVTKPALFGSFSEAYVIRYINGASLMRLTERYADYLQVAFLGYGRMDALTQDAGAVKYLVTA